MKKIILLTLSISLITSTLMAQERTHSGFYFSAALGPAWGTTNGSDNQGHALKMIGTGAEIDLQIGGSITKNLILHGTIMAKSVVGPEINGTKISNDYALSESMYGAGITHYTPNNFFFTGNAGVGKFTFDDGHTSMSTSNGFSFSLKAGKEWWVSKKLGIGAAFTYGKTKSTNTEGSYTEKWNSNKLGILLQLTFD
jgi:hypothetical protein